MTQQRRNYTKIRRDGQMRMEIEPLQLSGDIIAAIEEILEKHDSARDYAKAARRVKEAIPQVASGESRQFLVNDAYLVTATAFEVEGHEVRGGRRQRNQVSAKTDA